MLIMDEILCGWRMRLFRIMRMVM